MAQLGLLVQVSQKVAISVSQDYRHLMAQLKEDPLSDSLM